MRAHTCTLHKSHARTHASPPAHINTHIHTSTSSQDKISGANTPNTRGQTPYQGPRTQYQVPRHLVQRFKTLSSKVQDTVLGSKTQCQGSRHRITIQDTESGIKTQYWGPRPCIRVQESIRVQYTVSRSKNPVPGTKTPGSKIQDT